MNKTKPFLTLAAALFLLSCGNPPTDSGEDAAGTASPDLARHVVGVRLLTTDYQYENICDFLDEGFIRGAFNLGGFSELNVAEYKLGCRYQWKGGAVDVSFGAPRPYPSIYHAEYIFDKEYQPKALDEMDVTPRKPALSGPRPAGTGSDFPAIQSPKPENDSLAIIDSVTDVPGVVTHLTEAPYSTKQGMAVADVGDKAIWNSDQHTLHTLYLNHIINVTVKTSGSNDVQRQRAVRLTQVVIDKMGEADR